MLLTGGKKSNTLTTEWRTRIPYVFLSFSDGITGGKRAMDSNSLLDYTASLKDEGSREIFWSNMFKLGCTPNKH